MQQRLVVPTPAFGAYSYGYLVIAGAVSFSGENFINISDVDIYPSNLSRNHTIDTNQSLLTYGASGPGSGPYLTENDGSGYPSGAAPYDMQVLGQYIYGPSGTIGNNYCPPIPASGTSSPCPTR
jgi:hypothetical protein